MPFPAKISMKDDGEKMDSDRFPWDMWYDALIVDYEERENDKGPFVLVHFLLFNDEGYTMLVKDLAFPTMDWKLRSWFGLVENNDTKDEVEVDFNNLMNRHCRVFITARKNNPQFPNISKYEKTNFNNMPGQHVLDEQDRRLKHAKATVTTQPRPKVADQEDIPF